MGYRFSVPAEERAEFDAPTGERRAVRHTVLYGVRGTVICRRLGQDGVRFIFVRRMFRLLGLGHTKATMAMHYRAGQAFKKWGGGGRKVEEATIKLPEPLEELLGETYRLAVSDEEPTQEYRNSVTAAGQWSDEDADTLIS